MATLNLVEWRKRAPLAQWQSSGLLIRRLAVRARRGAPRFCTQIPESEARFDVSSLGVVLMCCATGADLRPWEWPRGVRSTAVECPKRRPLQDARAVESAAEAGQW
jgi:hypothetical protein